MYNYVNCDSLKIGQIIKLKTSYRKGVTFCYHGVIDYINKANRWINIVNEAGMRESVFIMDLATVYNKEVKSYVIIDKELDSSKKDVIATVAKELKINTVLCDIAEIGYVLDKLKGTECIGKVGICASPFDDDLNHNIIIPSSYLYGDVKLDKEYTRQSLSRMKFLIDGPVINL